MFDRRFYRSSDYGSGEGKRWITLIFSKGYEGKGVKEGLRYGFYIGMFIALPFAYGTYAMMPVPYSLALQRFLYGFAEYVVAGAAVARVYGKEATVTRISGGRGSAQQKGGKL